jgi:hypothetical protein
MNKNIKLTTISIVASWFLVSCISSKEQESKKQIINSKETSYSKKQNEVSFGKATVSFRSETSSRNIAAMDIGEFDYVDIYNKPTRSPSSVKKRKDPFAAKKKYLSGLKKIPVTPAKRKVSPKIISGSEVVTPWMLALISKEKYQETGDIYDGQICGATLIAPNWAITAAHCVWKYEEDDNWENDGNYPPESYQILSGTTELENGLGKLTDVAEIVTFPAHQNGYLNKDYVLLRLKEPILGVEPVSIVDDQTEIAVGSKVTIFGWGSIGTWMTGRNIYPRSLRYAESTIEDITTQRITDAEAEQGYEPIDPVYMLAVGKPLVRVGTCFGDSGGPTIVKDKNNKLVLVGVTSWGPADENGDCTFVPEYSPSMQANLYPVRNWIRSVITPHFNQWLYSNNIKTGYRGYSNGDKVNNFTKYAFGLGQLNSYYSSSSTTSSTITPVLSEPKIAWNIGDKFSTSSFNRRLIRDVDQFFSVRLKWSEKWMPYDLTSAVRSQSGAPQGYERVTVKVTHNNLKDLTAFYKLTAWPTANYVNFNRTLTSSWPIIDHEVTRLDTQLNLPKNIFARNYLLGLDGVSLDDKILNVSFLEESDLKFQILNLRGQVIFDSSKDIQKSDEINNYKITFLNFNQPAVVRVLSKNANGIGKFDLSLTQADQ